MTHKNRGTHIGEALNISTNPEHNTIQPLPKTKQDLKVSPLIKDILRRPLRGE